jgi:2-polyprenyl-3-methyl-5-hydroxy-6-metoxy-1,4-benzoquinol methylase
MMSITSYPCHICSGALLPLSDFSTLVQVTSDCRPWRSGGTLAACAQCGTVQKPTTTAWLQEADEIYAEYAIYNQGGGAEQATFDSNSGAATARSKKIVAWLNAAGQLPDGGKLLDIGCGNGAFLSAFSQQYPDWQLTGLELNDRNRAVVEAIPGVTQLHVGPLSALNERFDLIVLIHALEHIPEPVRYVAALTERLNPGGRLLIEVPDLDSSPFDILIADHATHFTARTLQHVVEAAGFAPLILQSGFVPKELSLLAVHAPDAASPPVANDPSGKDRDTAVAHLSWLQSLVDHSQQVQGDFSIFGTSISATWMAASMDRQADFFIDEDYNRVGGSHMGRPIYHPANMPPTPTVLLPLRADIAQEIAKRFAQLECQFVLLPV